MFDKTTKNDANEKRPRAEPAPVPDDQEIRSCSYFGPTLRIKGDITLDESLSIDGEVEGKIRCNGRKLTVGKQGRAAAEIHGSIVEVRGRVEGQIRGDEVVHLYSTAVVAGKLNCDRIVISDGAVFNGSVEMRKREPAKGRLTLASVSEDVARITT
jgi:cytoskeletal protein CcmA (bactofilin family)